MNPYVEIGGMKKGFFNRKIYISPEEVDDYRDNFNNSDYYCSAYVYDEETQEESNLIGDLYIDLDYDIETNQDYENLKRDFLLVVSTLENTYRIPKQNLKIYFSGNKGFHIIVPKEVLNIKPDKLLNVYFKYFAEQLKKYTLYKTVDTRIYDNKRLLRVSNTINLKTGLYKVPISFKDVQAFSYEDIKNYAKEPKEELELNIKECDASIEFGKLVDEYNNRGKKNLRSVKGKTLKEVPPCIKRILEEGATKGQRNNTAIIVANSLAQSGMELDSIIDTLLKWNTEKNNPCLPDSEIYSVSRSGYNEAQRDRHYGCSSIKDLELCHSDIECKFKK